LKFFSVAAVLTILSIAACSDSGTDVAPAEFTDADAVELFAVLTSAFIPSLSAPNVGTPSQSFLVAGGDVGFAMVPQTQVFADTTETTHACDVAGSVVVNMENLTTVVTDTRINPGADTTYAVNANYDADINVRSRYLGCSAQDDNGSTWVLNSDDLAWAITMTGNFDIIGLEGGSVSSVSNLQWDGTWGGNLAWERNGASGTCAVSLTMTSTTSGSGGQLTTSYSQTGTVCGVSVGASG